MPNWCENDLVIKAKSKKDLDEIISFISNKKGDLDFNKIIPYPDEYAEKDKMADKMRKEGKKNIPSDGYNSGGYQWCITNWGTKWNACSDSEEVKPAIKGNVAMYGFSTAWSPPEPIIIALGKKFPKANFSLKFYEGAMGFSGCLSMINGKIRTQSTYKYSGRRGG